MKAFELSFEVVIFISFEVFAQLKHFTLQYSPQNIEFRRRTLLYHFYDHSK